MVWVPHDGRMIDCWVTRLLEKSSTGFLLGATECGFECWMILLLEKSSTSFLLGATEWGCWVIDRQGILLLEKPLQTFCLVRKSGFVEWLTVCWMVDCWWNLLPEKPSTTLGQFGINPIPFWWNSCVPGPKSVRTSLSGTFKTALLQNFWQGFCVLTKHPQCSPPETAWEMTVLSLKVTEWTLCCVQNLVVV